MNIQSYLKQFAQKKIAVIGEMMLDCYYEGTSTRICREGPVPIVDVLNKKETPGGASNTALNVASLGAKTFFISVGGNDAEGRKIKSILQEKNITTDGVMLDDERSTLAKKRIVSEGQLLLRYDYGDFHSMSKELENRIIEYLNANFSQFDAVILSDYSYGVFTNKIIAIISELQKKYNKVIVVDSKNLKRFNSIDITAIKPNYPQTIELLGITSREKNRVEQIMTEGYKVFSLIPTKIAALTMDIDGSVIWEREKEPFCTPTKPMPNSNAAGAGDTFVATLTIMLTTNASTYEAAIVASKAAEIVVQQNGTTTCTTDDLFHEFLHKAKVMLNTDSLIELVKEYKHEGKKVIFTNGCFDLIQKAHIQFLNEAKSQGDILIVGVNSDNSVKQILGHTPFQKLEDRIDVLKELPMIDHIVPFHEIAPHDLLKVIQPDIFVKGGTYKDKTIPEENTVKEFNGKIKILDFYGQGHAHTMNHIPTNRMQFIHSLLLI